MPLTQRCRHRVFAELLEQGTRTSLKIPTHAPVPAPSAAKLAAQSAGPQRGSMDQDALRLLGLNPTHALQHPGFYYYMAAQSTESRRERFLHALNSEVCFPLSVYNCRSSCSIQATHLGNLSPGFANEKKVDHLAIILEVHTIIFTRHKILTMP